MYDPTWISRYYDDYGEREWERLDTSAPASERVNFETHRALLREYVHEGDRVLEVGAGPGRLANYLSLREDELLEGLDEGLWDAFLEWELEACREPGVLDGGTHIIAVVRRD